MPDQLAFAKDWEAAWNSHDLARVMAHYAPDVSFRSAKAEALVGQGHLQGHDPLRRYWEKALARQPDLRFTVREVFCGHDMMVITYSNHLDVLAAGTLRFRDDGRIIEASACHRAA